MKAAPAAWGFLLHGAKCSGLPDLVLSMQSCSPSSTLTTEQVGPRELEGHLMVPEGLEGPVSPRDKTPGVTPWPVHLGPAEALSGPPTLSSGHH